jgi:hypothetical protein
MRHVMKGPMVLSCPAMQVFSISTDEGDEGTHGPFLYILFSTSTKIRR